ncbi:MAG TPA: ChbG/HpnK family deacetylase, partial [Candidatus Aminicenantes bacterium]|nr:ChbG/HpnK family deacetylase [Candidatus Aminicenantes bacterium]
MKRVIVNADDFGLCQGVNRGIVLAHQKGILTSATLMANMPGFDEAVEMARDHPRLGVGVHLNLLRGEPVTPARDVASLVRADGFLHGSAYAFIRKL